MLLKIKTDIGCRVYIDDVLQGVATADTICKFPLEKGQYVVRFESFYDSSINIEKIILLRDYDVVEILNILSIIDRERLILIPCRNENGKWGYAELFSNKTIIEHHYSSVGLFYDGFAIVEKQHYGIIDKTDNCILECNYNSVERLNYGWYCIKEKDIYKLFHNSHGFITSFECTAPAEMFHFSGHLDDLRYCRIYKGNQKGIFDCKFGKILIPLGDYNCDLLSCDYKSFLNKGYLCYSIEDNNHKAIYEVFEDLYIKRPLKGLLKNGTLLTECKYRTIFLSSYQTVIVEVDGKWGVIDADGQEIFPCIYQSIDLENGGNTFVVKRNGGYGYISVLQKKEIIPCEYTSAGRFNWRNKLALVCKLAVEEKEYRFSFINEKGEIVLSIPLGFSPLDMSHPLNGALCPLKKDDENNSVYYLNKEGRIIRTLYDYERIGPSFEIDELQKEIDHLGLTIAKSNNKLAIIDAQGKTIISPIFDSLSLFQKHYIKCGVENKQGLLNIFGESIIPCKYEDIKLLWDTTVYAVKRDNKWGVFHYGRQSTHFVYDDILEYKDNCFRLMENGVVTLLVIKVNSYGQINIDFNVLKELGSVRKAQGLFVYRESDNEYGLLLDKFIPCNNRFNSVVTIKGTNCIELRDLTYMDNGPISSYNRSKYIEIDSGKDYTPTVSGHFSIKTMNGVTVIDSNSYLEKLL